MLRSTLMVVLAVLVLWMGVALVRVENERYALVTGMCRTSIGTADLACLERTSTRTHWMWHLWYALKG